MFAEIMQFAGGAEGVEAGSYAAERAWGSQKEVLAAALGELVKVFETTVGSEVLAGGRSDTVTSGEGWEGISRLVELVYGETVVGQGHGASGGAMAQAGMDEPEGPPGGIRVLDVSEEDISLFKKALLLGAYILQTALVVGVEASVWNSIRVLGGSSISEAGRKGTEAAAACFVALSYPEAERFANVLLAKLKMVPVFQGEESEIVRHFKMLLTGAGVGTAIDAGVQVATALEKSFSGRFNELMYLGYFVAFAIGGAVNAVGEFAVGGRLVAGGNREEAGATIKAKAIEWARGYVGLDRLVKERVPHFAVWFAYQFYGERMAELGSTFVSKQAGLWGSLWVFVLSFKLVFHWAAKLPVERRNAAGG